jgi:dihydroorotate dehydrogenase electron transfer subunit
MPSALRLADPTVAPLDVPDFGTPDLDAHHLDAPAVCVPGASAGFPVAENLCRVLVNEALNDDYRLMVAAAPAAALAARPGQFFHLACPPSGEDRPFLRRPMSIHAVDPAAGTITFLYKVQGAGTRGLATLAPGDRLDAFGPLGHGFAAPEGRRHLLMLARGVGLATLAPQAEAVAAAGGRVTAVLSARARDLVMAEDRLAACGCDTLVVTDTDGTSAVEALRARIAAIHAERPFDAIVTCGSDRLMRLARDFARAWGVPGEVALEQHMACAVGLCHACVRPFVDAAGETTYRRVCWDGPVFPIEEATSWSI